MSSLPRSSERGAARRRRDTSMRRLAAAAGWLVMILLALPVLDLVRRAGGGLDWTVFTRGDSIEADSAGIRAALQASLLAMLPVIFLATPLGLTVAVWLEEVAGGRRSAAWVGQSLRHLAMLPPVVFGLLGFSGLVVLLGLPVGTPLLAGAVLGLAMLPRIVLAAQLALRQVPAGVREAGFAMGASPLQVVATHVLPRATPAMLGASLSMLARAFGEAAPLLLVGFAAFSAGLPGSLTDPGIPLPVLVFRWAEIPDALFAAKAAIAALTLLVCVGALAFAGSLLERRGRTT